MSLFHCKSAVFILGVFLSQLSSIKSEEEPDFSFNSAWETFWSVSCEFSDLVENEGSTRSKRSIQEPNLEDPLELFNYLYPLADMKPEDYMASEEQRSANSFLSSWIQDLIHLWGSECHSRASGREKRHVFRRDADNGPPSPKYDLEDEIIEEEEDSHNPYRYEHEHEANINSEVFKNSTTPATKQVPAPKKEKKAVPDTDTFFAQYGGDIEYFFPLISFGIPFDGEITFLGFHGFKGLFPYK